MSFASLEQWPHCHGTIGVQIGSALYLILWELFEKFDIFLHVNLIDNVIKLPLGLPLLSFNVCPHQFTGEQTRSSIGPNGR